jgi:23S rRNA (uracil1939-C5)-methyltransferase
VRRHAPAFFQANRFLTPVVAASLSGWMDEGPIVDLYAGVGLFAVTLAGSGRRSITAVESDAISAVDLEWNTRPFADAIDVRRESVEAYLGRGEALARATLIVDPPRTGMSRLAVAGILRAGARRIVYVSCDVATLARDTRRLVDAGHVVTHIEALDLFPNTAHVEVLAVFDRR